VARTLLQLDLRCREHEAFTSDCPACCFVRRFDSEFDRLRQRRAILVRQLREKLRSGDVIAIDIV
jgi:hypothetical protein